MPPKASTVFATASSIESLSRTSPTIARPLPPAASISLDGGVDRARQLRVRLVRLRHHGDVGAVAGGADADRQADAAAAAGHQDRLALERARHARQLRAQGGGSVGSPVRLGVADAVGLRAGSGGPGPRRARSRRRGASDRRSSTRGPRGSTRAAGGRRSRARRSSRPSSDRAGRRRARRSRARGRSRSCRRRRAGPRARGSR